MKLLLQVAALAALSLLLSASAHAWGRHDLITKLALETPELQPLQELKLKAEPISAAAPDLLARALPLVNFWSESYFRVHDRRYSWTAPEPLASPAASPREQLLWALEDNTETPLDFSETSSDDPAAPRRACFGAPGLPTHGTASDVLVSYVNEPDAQLDNDLNAAPYLVRLRDRMSLFYEGTSHTHTFRHYYVPSSMIPPLLEPRGLAPYRAGLYAQLSIAAFKTGHRYWGYRFLAWAMHYAQDVTQPWHTVFVPSASYLHFSKARMRKEIAAAHYLTEALADSWLLRTQGQPFVDPNKLSSVALDPWSVPEWVERAAREAHAVSGELADNVLGLFGPVIESLDSGLHPVRSTMLLGHVRFPFKGFDFTGNGAGATAFLAPLWSPAFTEDSTRDAIVNDLAQSLRSGVELSRQIAGYVLAKSGELKSLL